LIINKIIKHYKRSSGRGPTRNRSEKKKSYPAQKHLYVKIKRGDKNLSNIRNNRQERGGGSATNSTPKNVGDSTPPRQKKATSFLDYLQTYIKSKLFRYDQTTSVLNFFFHKYANYLISHWCYALRKRANYTSERNSTSAYTNGHNKNYNTNRHKFYFTYLFPNKKKKIVFPVTKI